MPLNGWIVETQSVASVLCSCAATRNDAGLCARL